ncbi:MAG: T9SS C-terminal target domain-containing protein [Bacteroidetes bacterium]|nr:MAG: T9SS C-terminal target domain-containing protein [Bacteroidota bacterium]
MLIFLIFRENFRNLYHPVFKKKLNILLHQSKYIMKNRYILLLRKTLFVILITLPLLIQQALGGNDKTTEINTFPWFEDFNSVTPPALPEGWSSFVESTHPSARVETTTLVNPVSPPNQLRYIPINDPNAILLFISPTIGMPLNRLRVSFYALGLNSAANVAQVGSYSAENGFTPIASTTLTSEHQYYEFNLNGYQGNDVQLAIKAISDPSAGRPTYLDNLLIDTIPLVATVAVIPDSWEFEPVHYGESSQEKIFTITNTGLGTLVINPSDIFITGPDATDFTLNNLTQPVELEINETATVGVIFTPELEGDKVASIMVQDFEVPLSGNSYNPNITSLPHHEDFNDVTPPALPFGWTSYLETTSGQATVQTSNLMNPNSPPYHIRFGNFIDANANLILITPEIEFDLSLLRLGFYAKVNTTGATTMEVGTWDPEVTNSFTPLASVLLTTDYTYYFFEFEDYDGDAVHFAFRPVFDATYRWVALDDFSLNFAPQVPILTITPNSYSFEPLQAGTQSAPQQFTLSNAGGDTLVITPSDISISGPDADDFILEKITEEVHLAAGETAHINITFSPAEVGDKQATLQVKSTEVPIDGQAFDATITDFPWQEDFSGLGTGEIPFGWLRDSQNWGVSLTDNAGGQSPEMRFHFVPVLNGAFYLQTPLINTAGFQTLDLSFRHMVNNYSEPGIYTLRVVTLAGDEEYHVHEWVDPDDTPAQEFSIRLTAADHSIGAEDLRIAFVFDGATEDINHWFIDDILLHHVPEYYTATFVVSDEDGNEITDAVITFNGNEAAAGVYVFEDLEAGVYNYSVSRAGFFDFSDQVEITEQDVFVEVILEKDDTSVSVLQPGQLSVYPNPASNSITISAKDIIKEVSLMNISGQVVATIHPNTEKCELDVSGLSEGIYFLWILDRHGFAVRKVQVVR